MFSLLKRCKYSLYSDTMLNIGRVVLVSNETNTDVHMYIEEFILVDILDTLLYKVEVIWNGNHSSLYTNATID